ncbi:uncharacterized protein LOC143431751 [Xylocopa sonorina]|uniref:uncharacterized protein LOC143431750 n=1 Tax=Xylocopa sonorina TaxID=1818115 RepID=UPI00403B188D
MAHFKEEKEKVIKLARGYQQQYYELLPDWFEYRSKDYELIRHRIGYALFGPPKTDKDLPTLDINPQEIFDKVIYDKKMCKIIDKIYQKIIKYGREDQNDSIYIAIIFNVIFLHRVPKKLNNSDSNQVNDICTLPIFKLKKKRGVWYIDNEGRIYKSWEDYVKNNTLPECTMILPKSGLYQCDPTYKITKCCSTVWIEVEDSPTCATKSKVLRGVDIAASAVSICGTIGLSVASFFTPVGPLALTAGLVYGGVSGSWIIGRSTQKLVDLATHEQSIAPINKDALPAWLGIGSTVLALGANGGTVLLSKAVKEGSSVGTGAKIAYNSMVVSNLTVNGIGIAYQGYRLFDKYQAEKEVGIFDLVIFTSHVLFFGNAVISVKLAGELLNTSRGSIFERFQNTLRFNRLSKEFNRIYNGDSVQNESGGIVYKIVNVVNKEDFLNGFGTTRWTEQFSMKYSDGNIVINNRIFLDPITFTGHLLTVGLVGYKLMQPNSSLVVNDVIVPLKVLLKGLLKDYYAKEGFPYVNLPDVRYLNNIFQEIRYTNNAADVLTKIFKITLIVVKHCNDPRQFLFEAIYFLWTYCKANLKEYDANSANKTKMYDTLTNIVNFLYECIDELEYELFAAFYTYITNTQTKALNFVNN